MTYIFLGVGIYCDDDHSDDDSDEQDDSDDSSDGGDSDEFQDCERGPMDDGEVAALKTQKTQPLLI